MQECRQQQANLHVARQVDGELGGSEDMLGLGPGRQRVVWSHPPDEGTLAGLAHPKVARIQHPKPHLCTAMATDIKRTVARLLALCPELLSACLILQSC